MINGAHAVLFSRDAEADRAFLRDVLRFPNVDAGEGGLIFGLPPAEVAFHPSDCNDISEFYLMCDDIESFIVEMKENGTSCSAIQDENWGRLTKHTLPGSGLLGIYQPHHSRPEAMSEK